MRHILCFPRGSRMGNTFSMSHPRPTSRIPKSARLKSKNARLGLLWCFVLCFPRGPRMGNTFSMSHPRPTSRNPKSARLKSKNGHFGLSWGYVFVLPLRVTLLCSLLSPLSSCFTPRRAGRGAALWCARRPSPPAIWRSRQSCPRAARRVRASHGTRPDGYRRAGPAGHPGSSP